jgi:hypothetical protein
LGLGFLQILNGFEKEGFLLDNIGLSDSKTHLKKSVLICVIVVFLLKQLFVGLNLRLGRWELTCFL